MAEPTPAADGTTVPPEDSETGRAKHVATPEDDAVDHPAVARAATGPDAPTAAPASEEPTGSDRSAGSTDGVPVATAVPARPGATDGRDGTGTDGTDAAGPGPAATAAPASENEVAVARSEAAEARVDAARARTDAAEARSDAAETRTERLDPSEERTAAPAPEDRNAGDPASGDAGRTAVLPADRTPPPPAPRQTPTPMPPADAPPPPRRHSNRLVGTAWVLLAALVFEVLYLAAFALVVLVVAGSASVATSVQQLISTPFAWLPVVLFALFYELTVLLLNRAGRFAYVLSSLIVAAIVYLLSTVLILALQEGGISNEANLGRALIAPQVVLIPLIAREVMLWTGLAIGARGRRVRRRNREAQENYERERFASSVRDADDGARSPA